MKNLLSFRAALALRPGRSIAGKGQLTEAKVAACSQKRGSTLNRQRRFFDYGIFGSRETWMNSRARERE